MINTKVRIVGLVIGFVALAGLLGVLFLTVQRAQQLQSTINLPKAAELTWPACTTAGSGYTYPADNLSYLQSCCASLGSGGSIYDCTWPARGWCKPEQCDAAAPDNSAPANAKKGHCGLYLNNATSGCVGLGGCLKDSDCATGYTCQNITPPPAGSGYGTCSNSPKNPCWVNVPIPQDGSQAGGTLTWSYNAQWSSTVNVAIVYVWSCAQRIDGCYIGAASADASTGYKSVKLSSIPGIKPGVTYFWKVNVNSYAPPNGDQTYACMDTATQGWTFNTAGQCVGATPDTCGSTCTNLKTDVSNCGTCGTSCGAGKTCTNGSCVNTSNTCTSNADCPGSKPYCVDGGCVASNQTHLGCGSNSTCIRVSGSGNNTDGCTTLGDSCTTSNTCSVDSDCGAELCVDNSCLPPSQTHLGCGSSNTCVRLAGSGNNTDGCTIIADACTSSTNQANACWGNGGVDGKCYDINGDGVINILDFQRLSQVYNQPVQ